MITVRPLLLRLALSVKCVCKRAGDVSRLLEVTELRACKAEDHQSLSQKQAEVLVMTVPWTDLPFKPSSPEERSCSVGAPCTARFPLSSMLGVCVLFSYVPMISWMESRTSSMGFLICQSQTRPFTPRTRSPSITLGTGMRKVRQMIGCGASDTSCPCVGKKLCLGIRK